MRPESAVDRQTQLSKSPVGPGLSLTLPDKRRKRRRREAAWRAGEGEEEKTQNAWMRNRER